MFHMANKLGNVHKFAKDARKRDELIALGYHELVEAPAEEERGVEDVAPYDGPEQTDEPQQVDDPLQMYTTEDDTQATAAIDDDIEEGAQATAEGDNTTEDDTQATAAIDDDIEEGAQATAEGDNATEGDAQATAAIDDDIEEGAQAAAEGDNATEDDAQAEVNPKKRKTKKNAAEE